MRTEILFEGLRADEILSLSDEELSALVFEQDSIVMQVGSSRILGRIVRETDRLVVELAHIDGGGEGVLPALGALVARFAKRRGVATVEWLVHATNCAEPNPKLRPILERRGFVVEEVPGIGEVYRQVSGIELHE